MSTVRHLRSADADTASGVPMAEAIAAFLRWLSTKCGRSGRLTSPQTLRAYTSALPRAFAGIPIIDALLADDGHRLRTNLRIAWSDKKPSTFNAKRAAVASALSFFRLEGWLPPGTDLLAGLEREPEPKPAERARDRATIDWLISAKTRPLQDRALFAMLYATAARCDEVLRLNIEDLDRANRRAHTIRKGGRPDTLLYDTHTARLLGQLLGKRTSEPVFLSDRRPTDGTVPARDLGPDSGRRRLTYRIAVRRLAAATDGWTPHDLRHSRLTHADEDGTTEADLMNLSGHEDRRTLQRYFRPSKEGTHRRLDALDAVPGHRDPTKSPHVSPSSTLSRCLDRPVSPPPPLPGMPSTAHLRRGREFETAAGQQGCRANRYVDTGEGDPIQWLPGFADVVLCYSRRADLPHTRGSAGLAFFGQFRRGQGRR